MRDKTIDFLKGCLVLLVICGHILQGSVSDNLLRYIIYSFHMPIFTGISGYLFKTLVLIGFLISLVSYRPNLCPAIYEHSSKLNFIIKAIQEAFRPYFYVFFVLGVYVRTGQKNKYPAIEQVVLGLSIIGTVLLFFYPSTIIKFFLFFIPNIALLSFYPPKSGKRVIDEFKTNRMDGKKFIRHLSVARHRNYFDPKSNRNSNLILFYGAMVC